MLWREPLSVPSASSETSDGTLSGAGVAAPSRRFPEKHAPEEPYASPKPHLRGAIEL
jgi:hypothetical protein